MCSNSFYYLFKKYFGDIAVALYTTKLIIMIKDITNGLEGFQNFSDLKFANTCLNCNIK